MTKHLTILTTFLFFTSLSFGQRVSETDSLLIMAKVKSVFSVIKNPVFNEFEKLSTEKIYCTICFGKPNFTNAPYILERRKFYDKHLKKLSQSNNFNRAIKSTDIILIKGNDHRTDITVLFTIYQRGELALEHEGGQLGLYFKKVSNEYKFAGIEIIP